MTTRQQIARLLPLVLLVVLIIAGLRGAVSAPRWTGPLRADGVAIGIALEVVFGVLLAVLRVREAAARRAAELRPYSYSAQDKGIEPPRALRFTLSYVLAACMVAIGVVLITNLHLHFFIKGRPLKLPKHPNGTLTLQPGHGSGTGSSFHIPVGPILYGLLIVVLIAAVAVSVWWTARLRRPAAPLVIEDVGTQELREAVAEGRAALGLVDDARAAIIACYLAMERSLAERGTARTVADTPDELLGRAVAAGTVRGGAAGRLTALFYEARFSTHPLGTGQRDVASAALDELAAELDTEASRATQTAPGSEQAPARPGGGWV
ncbi:MAG TPA: DUF4129 domain-containing protein [Trebonia sp.]|nr:DUF4129 domain-containing protein [Trebonia sp.]